LKFLSLNKNTTVKTLVLLIFMGLAVNNGLAADMPQMPKPTPEHQWLQQLVGEWESETEAIAEPGQPAIHSKGTENIEAIGGFWTTSEINSSVMEQPFRGMMTLGYDPEKKKYIGTWVDSMTGKLWQYEGLIAPGSNTLTLESEGTCPMSPDKPMKFRDIIELKDKDHKVFSSSVLSDDGKWTTIMTSKAQRKH
jgi:hypothetical protein